MRLHLIDRPRAFKYGEKATVVGIVGLTQGEGLAHRSVDADNTPRVEHCMNGRYVAEAYKPTRVGEPFGYRKLRQKMHCAVATART
jgi:hypothetical protein